MQLTHLQRPKFLFQPISLLGHPNNDLFLLHEIYLQDQSIQTKRNLILKTISPATTSRQEGSSKQICMHSVLIGASMARQTSSAPVDTGAYLQPIYFQPMHYTRFSADAFSADVFSADALSVDFQPMYFSRCSFIRCIISRFSVVVFSADVFSADVVSADAL